MLTQIIKSDCGCEFETSPAGQVFRWCPLHKVAPEMHETLKDIWVYLAPKCHEARVKILCDKVGQVLAKAEGKESAP
jgi:hypothetical protein